MTGGGVQSNHARMTAAAASRLGLDCHLVLGGPRPGPQDGERAPRSTVRRDPPLHHGAGRRARARSRRRGACAEVERADRRRRRTVRHGGGKAVRRSRSEARRGISAGERTRSLRTSSRANSPDAGITHVDTIVVADGSGGTHAGLLAGLPRSTTVVGVDVGTRAEPRRRGSRAGRLGRERERAAGSESDLVIDRDHFGDGYGALHRSLGLDRAQGDCSAGRGSGIDLRLHGQGDGGADRTSDGDGRISAGVHGRLLAHRWSRTRCSRTATWTRSDGGPLGRAEGKSLRVADLLGDNHADGDHDQEQQQLLHVGGPSSRPGGRFRIVVSPDGARHRRCTDRA